LWLAGYSTDGTLTYLNSVTLCSDGSFCCGAANTDCCAAGRGHAQILFGQDAPLPSASDTMAISSYYAGVHVSTLPITRSSSGNSSSTVSSFSSFLPTQSASSNSMPNQGGLSTGAKAGIGVGLGLGALLATIGIVFFLMSKRKRKAPGEGREVVEIEAHTRPELDVPSVDFKSNQRRTCAELDTVDNRHQRITQNELEV